MNETKNETGLMNFDEDSFDLTAHRKAADAVARKKNRIKRTRRQVTVGKTMLALVAFIVFFLLFFVVVELLAIGF